MAQLIQNSDKQVLLTGATGSVGGELLGRLLINFPERNFLVLARPSRNDSAEKRIRNLLEETFGGDRVGGLIDRVQVVESDLSLDEFGLGSEEYSRLGQSIDSVIHCAASTSLGAPIEDARFANVASTERLLDLAIKANASLGKPLSFYHVSTAYVAGDTDAVVSPDRLNLRANFRNGYEQSKAESEQMVRALTGELDTCIFRPSMIVGDSGTGQTNAFNVIYIPARYLASGILSFLPAHPNTPCDLVPVDYVADAMIAFGKTHVEPGSCFHLAAGVGRESVIREIVEFIFKVFNQYRRRGLGLMPLPNFIPPAMGDGGLSMKQLEQSLSIGIRLLKEIFHLIPYMVRNPRFDTSSTLVALDGVVEQPPLFSSYAEKVFDYCAQTNWGKREWSNPRQLENWYFRAQTA